MHQVDYIDGVYDDATTRQRIIWQNGKPGPTCPASAIRTAPVLRMYGHTEPFGTYPEPPRVGVDQRNRDLYEVGP